MFADLDESLRQLLVQRGSLDPAEIDVSFDKPTREWAAGLSRPTISLYLFDIRENLDLRNPVPWTVRSGPNNTAIKSRPEVRLDLTYRVTAFANAVADEHRLLSQVLVTLLQHPVFPPELQQGEAAGQEIVTAAAQPSGIIQSPADYWSVVDNDIKPAIDYKLTVHMDLRQETSVGLARSAALKVGEKKDSNGHAAIGVEEVRHDIGGTVRSQGAPDQGLPGAKVALAERGEETVTDAQGRYRFRRLLAGSYTLVITAPGLETRLVSIQVPGGDFDAEV
ncbi:MAG: DUF4255 domain-containing protein [SAR202 cluster bacterium]|nr:DUF4255 domain-containing protein [SAR202 cluster bacterium]